MDALTERQERIVQAYVEGLGPDNNDRKGHTTMTTITQSLPSTNYEHPSDDQMDALAARIRREGDVGGAFGDAEFSRAFVAAGYVFRLANTEQQARVLAAPGERERISGLTRFRRNFGARLSRGNTRA